MQLTGTPFFILTVILVPVSIAVALLYWSKVRGPNPVRILSRLVMIMFCQITAVLMVFVMVNNANLIYGNWDDLLGTGDHVRAVPQVAPADQGASGKEGAGQGGGDAAKQPPKALQKFAGVGDPAVPGDVQKTEAQGPGVRGRRRGAGLAAAAVQRPGVQGQEVPGGRADPGLPGLLLHLVRHPQGLRAAQAADAAGQGLPVHPGLAAHPAPRQPPGRRLHRHPRQDQRRRLAHPGRPADDHGQLPRRPVPGPLGHRRLLGRRHCAAKLSLAHPNRYRAAISMSGYNDPASESDSLVGKDPKLREANNPVNILKSAQQPPKVSLYISGKKGDGLEDGQAIAAAAKEPTKVQVQESNGPHTTELWKTMVPSIFEWMTSVIPPQ